MKLEELLERFWVHSRRFGVLEDRFERITAELSGVYRRLQSDEEKQWLAGFPRDFRADWMRTLRLRRETLLDEQKRAKAAVVREHVSAERLRSQILSVGKRTSKRRVLP